MTAAVAVFLWGAQFNDVTLFGVVPAIQLMLAHLTWITPDDIYRVMEISFNIGIGAYTGWYFGASRHRIAFMLAFSLGTVTISVSAALSARAAFQVTWAAFALGSVALIVATSVAGLREKEVRATCRDSLTGALNRKGLEHYLRESRRNSQRRSDNSSALLVLDLDKFKMVNDTEGHLAGDRALKAFSEPWLGSLRREDCFARVGGDEFLLILKGASQADARKTVQRIASQSAFPFSFGITTLSKDEDFDTAFARADRSLYMEKQRRK